MTRVAIVQETPTTLNRVASIELAAALTAQAARAGARVVVFPEAFVPGYPAWIWRIAREGGCWVLGAGCVLQGRDLPRDLPGREHLFPDDEDYARPDLFTLHVDRRAQRPVSQGGTP